MNYLLEANLLESMKTGNELWVAGTLPGIATIKNNALSKLQTIYYPDYFISDVFKDKEGNILLSTFDKGILVIPDLNVPDAIRSYDDTPITSLYSDSKMGLVMGSLNGKLMNYYDKKITIIDNKGKRPIEIVYGSNNSDLVLFDNGKIRAFNKQTKVITEIMDASLKDATFGVRNKLYLGTNIGLVQLKSSHSNSYTPEIIEPINKRIYSLEYNLTDSCLYAATASGLYVIFPSGIAEKISLNEGNVFADYLLYYKGNTYASTKKNGILVIKNGKISSAIKPLVNDKLEPVKKMCIYQNTIIAKSSNGLFQFDLNGKMLKSIHSVFGFSSRHVIDFTISSTTIMG